MHSTAHNITPHHHILTIYGHAALKQTTLLWIGCHQVYVYAWFWLEKSSQVDVRKALLFIGLILCWTSQARSQFQCACKDTRQYSPTGKLQLTALVQGPPGLKGSKGDTGPPGWQEVPGPYGPKGDTVLTEDQFQRLSVMSIWTTRLQLVLYMTISISVPESCYNSHSHSLIHTRQSFSHTQQDTTTRLAL